MSTGNDAIACHSFTLLRSKAFGFFMPQFLFTCLTVMSYLFNSPSPSLRDLFSTAEIQSAETKSCRVDMKFIKPL